MGFLIRSEWLTELPIQNKLGEAGGVSSHMYI